MKQLEITTNKRLLIVEYPSIDFANGIEKISEFQEKYKLICKGSDLTDDIAKGLVEEIYHPSISFYKDYNSENPNEIGSHCEIKSFISAIESKNYYWGENPYEKELDSCNAYTDMFTIAKRARKYEEAKDRTFNPSKCIIFEIV